MRTIWKYNIPVDGLLVELIHPLVVHVGIDPAGIGMGLNVPTVWIQHEPADDEMFRQIHATPIALFFVGTGHDVPNGAVHVGSVVTPTGLVWHAYRSTS